MVEIDDEFKKAMLNRDEKLEKFDKHGITDDYLIGKLKGELEAKYTKVLHHKGKIIDTREITDWKIQQDARKDAHKLKGDYPAEKHEHSGDVIFHSNVPEPDMPKEEKEQEKSSFPDHPNQLEPEKAMLKDVKKEISGKWIPEEEEETLYVTPQKK